MSCRLSIAEVHFAPGHSISGCCRRGHLANIHPGRDFYIALAPHEDWSSAHTAWGFISDLSAAEVIVQQPYTESVHAATGTHMRMLNDPVPFIVQLADEPMHDVVEGVAEQQQGG